MLQDLLGPAVFFVIYIGLQVWLLPRLGVPT